MEAAMTFTPGETVAVKSGGPALTVLSVEGDHVKCLFFSEELGEFKETVLPAFALEGFDSEEEEDDEEDDAEESDVDMTDEEDETEEVAA
jgi:uncharacterized protein YodC (DUF2158 family)